MTLTDNDNVKDSDNEDIDWQQQTLTWLMNPNSGYRGRRNQ